MYRSLSSPTMRTGVGYKRVANKANLNEALFRKSDEHEEVCVAEFPPEIGSVSLCYKEHDP